MTYKKNIDLNREKKIHKVIKGKGVEKHRKYLYNMFSDDDTHLDRVLGNKYHGNINYDKRR